MSNRCPLAVRQQALMSVIFDFSSPADVDEAVLRGLKVYQNNLLLTAARSLSISYPVLEALVGQQMMVALAKRTLHLNRPQSGDWAEWGSELSNVLNCADDLMRQHPYLADMARLEWTIHGMRRRPPTHPKLSTVFLLEESDPESIAIKLSPSISLFESEFPVHGIWRAHRSQQQQGFDQAVFTAALSEDDSDGIFVVYELGGIQVRPIPRREFCWMLDISKGMSVSELLDRHPNMDFAGWFAKAIERNWIEQLYKIN